MSADEALPSAAEGEASDRIDASAYRLDDRAGTRSGRTPECTRRTVRLRIRWWWIATVLFLAVAPFAWYSRRPSDRSDRPPATDDEAAVTVRGLLADYPELLAADPEVCEAIHAMWAERAPADRDHLDVQRFDRPWLPPDSEGVKLVLARAGDRAAVALLLALLERTPRPTGSFRHWDPEQDADYCPCGIWLRENASRDLDPLLLRMIRDRRLHENVRSLAVVVLCRPESASSIKELAGLACDPNRKPWLRLDIVQRLPRMSAPLLEHLRPLLYQPFHHLDREAATALAHAGEPEAPSLLHEAVLAALPYGGVNGERLAQAILKMTEEDPDLLPHVAHFRRFHTRRWSETSPEARERQGKDAARTLADAFERWLAAHPAARNTRFERERAAYLAGSRRQREEAIQRFEDILKADEGNLDLGAAAVWCERPGRSPEDLRYRRSILERLNRLSLLLKQDIRGLEDPEAVVAAINRRLFPGHASISPSWEGNGPASTLGIVLREHCGKCVGFSVLLLALGERMGLPLHGVRAPNHVFVRWDDGRTRRNIETTAQGAARDDADYYSSDYTIRRVTPEDLAEGRYLRNLTRKQVIADLLNNLSAAYLESPNLKPGRWRYERARECADQAIRLDPTLVHSYYNRAAASIELRTEESEVFCDIRNVLRLDRQSVHARVWAAALYYRLGRFQEALGHYERVLSAEPEVPEAELGRIHCLLALDRSAEALALADAMTARGADDRDLELLRLTALVRRRDPRWPEELEPLLQDPDRHPDAICVSMAGLLLRKEPGVEPDPMSALLLLARIADAGDVEGDEEGCVIRKRPGDRILMIRKESIRAIQRERDELRARARALLDAAK
jgi:tetratricopeptide (TPR) repeat protein